MKRIVLAGGAGFLGRSLAHYFAALGWDVVILTRAPRESTGSVREVKWDGRTVGDWAAELEDAEAVVNLAGRSVDCRYTNANRREIMSSRVDPTRAIGEAIRRCTHPPKVWLNASTATIYKHTFGPPWNESGETGATPEAHDAFSVEVARAWEAELFRATTPNTRKAALRTAMVFGSGKNSVFPVLRRLVRLSLGGKMGSGKQFASWIHEADFCRAIEWLITHEIAGIVNICAPNPLTNADMMRQLRAAYGMPFGLPARRWMLEVGAVVLRTETELILKSRRVIPARLLESGFEFRWPEFRDAIADLENGRD